MFFLKLKKKKGSKEIILLIIVLSSCFGPCPLQLYMFLSLSNLDPTVYALGQFEESQVDKRNNNTVKGGKIMGASDYLSLHFNSLALFSFSLSLVPLGSSKMVLLSHYGYCKYGLFVQLYSVLSVVL